MAAPERWDEACFAVPALRALVASGLGVGILCTAAQREFWETLPGLQVIDFPPAAKAKLVAATLKRNWEASLCWETGWAAEVFKRAEIPRRLGPAERKLARLLTHPLTLPAAPLEHRVRFYLSLVGELGIEAALPEFFAPADLGILPADDAVLLCPGSDFGPNHEWPLDRWAEIGRMIRDNGRRITIASVHGGRGAGKSLADLLGGEIEHIDASPLAAALPVLAVHARVIAADGSLPHLAAHAGSTCLVLFGPNDPAWKRPLGRRHAIVRRHVECAPCLLPKCPLDLRCQTQLSAERVRDAVARFI